MAPILAIRDAGNGDSLATVVSSDFECQTVAMSCAEHVGRPSHRSESLVDQKFIDASSLRVGDVLLTQSNDKISRAIVKATGGRFSHAAIYVRDYQLFEATTTGVGFGALVPKRIEIESGRQKVLCSTEGFRDVAVFRCPPQCRKPPSDHDDRLLFALYPLLWSLNGVEYKKLGEFKNIKSRFDWIPKSVRAQILKHAGALFLKDQKKILVQEFFCSELVVHALSEVGMQVMKNNDACPAEISPKDLADGSISNLIEESGAICTANPSATTASESVLAVAQMFATPSSNKRIVKMTKELQQHAETIFRNMKDSVRSRKDRGL